MNTKTHEGQTFMLGMIHIFHTGIDKTTYEFLGLSKYNKGTRRESFSLDLPKVVHKKIQQ